MNLNANSDNWFGVDRKGLRRTRAHNKPSLLLEMIQNTAIDTDATEVTITLTPAGRGRHTLVVTDNDPHGYADISHAWMLYAPSTKADDPSKAGMFNLGEKQVAAWAVSGEILTMGHSGVVFHEDGTRTRTKRRTKIGSYHEFLMEITQPEAEAMINRAHRVIVPERCTLTINGVEVCQRPVMTETYADLAHFLTDDNGAMVERPRKTRITLHPEDMDGAWLYNLGLPVQRIEGPWSVNVHARLKIDTQRDQITDRQMRLILIAVVDHMHEQLDKADITTWARPTLAYVTPEATKTMVDALFGENAVVYDPSDHDANTRAADNDVAIIHGGSLSGDEWANLRMARMAIPDLARSAGSVYGEESSFAPATYIPEAQWTPEERRVVAYAHEMHRHLFGTDIPTVVILESPGSTTLADWGNGTLRFNTALLPKGFWTDEAEVIDLLLHEFGHRAIPGHSEAWGKEVAHLAGKVVVWGGRL